MKCVVLAAGSATRMRPLSEDVPKCLLAVGGKPILERIIENLLAAGVEELGLVLGYRREAIRAFVKRRFPSSRIRFIVNPKYESTNNAFSLLLARDFFMSGREDGSSLEELLLLDADIVFAPGLLPALLANSARNKLAVRVDGAHDEEEIRVTIDAEGTIRLVGKMTPLHESFGESIGIELFSPPVAKRLFQVLEQRVQSGPGRTEFYEASFQALIDEGIRLTAVDVSRHPSIEIDTPDDLRLAKDIVRTGFDLKAG